MEVCTITHFVAIKKNIQSFNAMQQEMAAYICSTKKIDLKQIEKSKTKMKSLIIFRQFAFNGIPRAPTQL